MDQEKRKEIKNIICNIYEIGNYKISKLKGQTANLPQRRQMVI